MKHLPVAAVALVALVASTAWAHTELTGSTPADKATVTTPVKEIVLQFEEPVRLTALSLADASGAKKTLADVPKEDAARFAIAVRDELAPGDYVATWRAVGDDTHVVTGQIHFTVGMAHSH
jgi:methionine-rich copper-binding protein CopC